MVSYRFFQLQYLSFLYLLSIKLSFNFAIGNIAILNLFTLFFSCLRVAKWLKMITIWQAIEQNLLLLLQYWKMNNIKQQNHFATWHPSTVSLMINPNPCNPCSQLSYVGGVKITPPPSNFAFLKIGASYLVAMFIFEFRIKVTSSTMPDFY